MTGGGGGGSHPGEPKQDGWRGGQEKGGTEEDSEGGRSLRRTSRAQLMWGGFSQSLAASVPLRCISASSLPQCLFAASVPLRRDSLRNGARLS
eukprot:1404516-Rhodomonas_salina.4